MAKLPRHYYQQADVVALAQNLVGKALYTHIDGVTTGGMIVETEAYSGSRDRACHAFLHRRTQRTAIFYQPGGLAYVYLCYGIHALFNIITNVAEAPDAVLIRAIEPLEGIGTMLRRRGLARAQRKLTGGPGCVTQALGITTADYGEELTGDRIWLETRGDDVDANRLIASPRVGVGYAGEDAQLPWRFRLRDSSWTSPAK